MHPVPRTVLHTALAALTLTPNAGAQELEPRPIPTRNIQSFTFHSPSMGVKFAINVGLPKRFDANRARKYPALITTDGDWAFPVVNESARLLMMQEAIEDLVIVSIGSLPAEGDSGWTRRRVYEFSPPNWDRKDAFGQRVEQLCIANRTPGERCTGGAPRFLAVIASELIPLVAARYAIDREQLGLFGASAGGFFATYAMFQPNAPFKKYLISSPAMAYGDGAAFREEAKWAAERKDLPVTVYFGAGTLEMLSGQYEGTGKIVSGMAHMVGVLSGRNYPGLKITSEVHPGLDHADVIGTVVTRGLRTLFPRMSQ